ncbi:MAG: hypothetical protein U0794_17990 [Isosphaeraceae bacterium]
MRLRLACRSFADEAATRPCLVGLTLLALTLSQIGCGDEPVFPFDDAACKASLTRSDAVDAFAWFKDPYGGEKRLGDWSTDQGLAFAHQLEILGAKRVVAVGVHEVPGTPPSRAALGLVAELPDDLVHRKKLFERHASQVRSIGYRPRPDTGQRFLLFSWQSPHARTP